MNGLSFGMPLFFERLQRGEFGPQPFSRQGHVPARWFGDAKYYEKIRGFGTRHLLGPERGRLEDHHCVSPKKTVNASRKRGGNPGHTI